MVYNKIQLKIKDDMNLDDKAEIFIYDDIKKKNAELQDSPFANMQKTKALAELDKLFKVDELFDKTRNGNSFKSFLIDAREYSDCSSVFLYLTDQISQQIKEENKADKSKTKPQTQTQTKKEGKTVKHEKPNDEDN